jgi:hypothetical protein
VVKGPTAVAKIPEEVLVGLDWVSLVQRLTAVAHQRIPTRSIEEAKQLAKETVRIFLDPDSTVTWDPEKEPDPFRCLGSILNGLFRNYFRRKRTNAEVATGSEQIEASTDASSYGPSPEGETIARDLRQKILSRVYELSPGDELVQNIAVLTNDGLIDVDQQAQELNVPKAQLYEARRRFKERLAIARRELEEGP